MNILPVDTYEQAEECNRRAFDFLRQESGANGSGWSDIFIDYGKSPRFGILFSGEIAGAFTEKELATVLIDEEPLVRDEDGNFISGNWEKYTPPPPEVTLA